MAYVWKLFAPVNLCAFYPYPAAGDTGKAVYLMAPFFFAALAALALWDARRTRVIAFGVGWYAATVALVLQWIPVGGAIMADRYAYLSYLGLFFVLAMAVDGLLGRSRTLGIGLLAVCGLFAVMLFAGTLAQVEVWRDTETLWNQAIRLYPGVGASHVYRGKQRSLSGRIPEALDDFRTARDLGYRTADVYEGLGAAYGSLGKLDSALVMLDQAVRLEPRRGGLYYNRAVTNLALGRPREALSDLDRALALVPDRAAEFWAPRDYARMQLGEYAEAIPEFDRAIAAGAAGAAIRYSRGFCRLRLGDRAGAAADFRETLRLDPGHAEARVQLRALGI
jgi:tetratricopeptide (TPR) repeat protein